MKILITGAHQTGKTALACELAKRLSLPVITDLMREVPALSQLNLFKPFSEFNANEHFSFNSKLFEIQLDFEKKFKSFISDRSLFDFSARFVLYGANILFPELVIKLFNIAKQEISKVDFIFFLKINENIPLTGDNITETNIFLRQFTENVLLSMFKYNIPSDKIWFVNISDLEERLDFVLQVIQKAQRTKG